MLSHKQNITMYQYINELLHNIKQSSVKLTFYGYLAIAFQVVAF